MTTAREAIDSGMTEKAQTELEGMAATADKNSGRIQDLLSRLNGMEERLQGPKPTEVSRDTPPARLGVLGALGDSLELTRLALVEAHDILTRLEDLT